MPENPSPILLPVAAASGQEDGGRRQSERIPSSLPPPNPKFEGKRREPGAGWWGAPAACPRLVLSSLLLVVVRSWTLLFSSAAAGGCGLGCRPVVWLVGVGRLRPISEEGAREEEESARVLRVTCGPGRMVGPGCRPRGAWGRMEDHTTWTTVAGGTGGMWRDRRRRDQKNLATWAEKPGGHVLLSRFSWMHCTR